MGKSNNLETTKKQLYEEMYQKVSQKIAAEKEKYVVTDKPFVRFVDSKYHPMMEYDDITGQEYETTRQTKDITIEQYTPKKENPGLYDVRKIMYMSGKKDKETILATETKTLTWDELKNGTLIGQLVFEEKHKSYEFFPSKVLCINDGQKMETIEKDWKKNAEKLLGQIANKKIHRVSLPLTEEEKVDVYCTQNRLEAKKDEILEIKRPNVDIKKPFSFITSQTYGIYGTYYSGISGKKIQDVVVLGKRWDKSPLDENVTVYTFTPHDPEMPTAKGYSTKGFDVKETHYKNGKVNWVSSQMAPVDISWKDFKRMADNERKLHAAHVRAGGKFYPKDTMLFKSDKEFQVFKDKHSKSVAKGITRKACSQEHER